MTTAVAFANYYGRDHVGSIRGALSPLVTGSVALGPVLIAVGYDFQGTYTSGFLAMVALFVAAGGLALLAKPPRKAGDG